jgi:hypothetical protein
MYVLDARSKRLCPRRTVWKVAGFGGARLTVGLVVKGREMVWSESELVSVRWVTLVGDEWSARCRADGGMVGSYK